MAIVQPADRFCGGTLVASKYVVTAAHCVVLDNTTIINPRLIKVRNKIRKKMLHIWFLGDTRGT